MHATFPLLKETDFPGINRSDLTAVQVNLGYRCNQQCLHCHVNAGPNRKEEMNAKTISQLKDYLLCADASTLDLTGGAPELNPNFRELVCYAKSIGMHVIDRCNLTVLEEPGQEGLAEFLAEQGVEITASLPCYLEENVNAQRGKEVYAKSIRVLQKLNSLGYGDLHNDDESKTGNANNGLILNLMFNPQGPVLPPPQQQLEADYRQYLAEHFGITFNQLFTLTNMPIKRFGSTLISKGGFEGYMSLLRDSFKEENAHQLMCRNTISIDWQGYVYDCDFNQLLDMPLVDQGGSSLHIRNLINTNLQDRPVMVADHCYGCTAGQGSSCGGALNT